MELTTDLMMAPWLGSAVAAQRYKALVGPNRRDCVFNISYISYLSTTPSMPNN
jgi:hypothetical protein